MHGAAVPMGLPCAKPGDITSARGPKQPASQRTCKDNQKVDMTTTGRMTVDPD